MRAAHSALCLLRGCRLHTLHRQTDRQTEREREERERDRESAHEKEASERERERAEQQRATTRTGERAGLVRAAARARPSPGRADDQARSAAGCSRTDLQPALYEPGPSVRRPDFGAARGCGAARPRVGLWIMFNVGADYSSADPSQLLTGRYQKVPGCFLLPGAFVHYGFD